MDALLGDRIRMNSISHPRAYMLEVLLRESDKALKQIRVQKRSISPVKRLLSILSFLKAQEWGKVMHPILDYCDVSLYVMTPEYGAASQLEKINMLDYADLVAINKFDKAGALDALADVRKQYKRNHQLFSAKDNDLPIVGTMASKFNDDGINHLFELMLKAIEGKTKYQFWQISI